MVREEALRAINEDQLDYIQQPVIVDFNTTNFMPVSFTTKGKKHEIGEVLERFRTRKGLPVNAFLVRTHGGHVFLLYFHFNNFSRYRATNKGRWILKSDNSYYRLQ